jgi:para-aminobenzoate synthetase component 1
MKEVENSIRKMNRLGAGNIPFLFIVDFEMKKPVFMTLEEASTKNIFYDVNGLTNYYKKRNIDKKVVLKKYPVAFDDYFKSFNIVADNLKAGNTYLLNLTFQTKIEINFSLEEIFFNSIAKYKLLYGDKFVVFSPETFVKIIDGKIYSYPMKGTIDAGIKNAREIILNDEKEKAEHTTIVDLIRNDLSMIADNVEVEEFRFVDKIKTNEKELLQVSSKISGNLPENYNEKLGDIIFQLLPAGSISGAPKGKTIEIIKSAESYKRGFYTGVFGIFDGKNVDCAVMIRFIENMEGDLYFKSGGGITAKSDPRKEYQELIDKVYVPIF